MSEILKLAIGVFVTWVLVYVSAAVEPTLLPLASASSAPLIGLCGTLIGIEGVRAFKGSKPDE
jgi:hypothetical protein